MELSPIQPSSIAFSQLEYDLQSISKASTLRIQKAYEISNPSLTVQFDRKSKNLLILDSWIDTGLLKSPNEETDIVKKGFQIASSNAGLLFPVGPLDLNHLSNSGGKMTRRMILCKIAVGRAYCAMSYPNDATGSVPEGYDSYYLDPPSADHSNKRPEGSNLTDLSFCNNEFKESGHSEPLQFIIKHSSQILPRFIVEFEYDPKLEKQSRQKSICDNCEHTLASLYCQADAAHLCTSCDMEIHRSKLSSRHTRFSLDKGPQCIVPCRSHPERTAEFFCPTCHVLVCLNCKMVGHHSTGESVKHPLVSVTEAYQSVLESAHAPDPVIDEKQASLCGQLEKIEKRGNIILANAKSVREQLDRMYQKAIVDLNEIVHQRLLILKGDAQEYKRLLGEISRIRNYLTYLETGRDATLFLLSWHQYLQAKAELPLLSSSGKECNSAYSSLESPLYVSGSLQIISSTESNFPKKSNPPPPHSSIQQSLAGSTFSLAPLSHSMIGSNNSGNSPSLFKNINHNNNSARISKLAGVPAESVPLSDMSRQSTALMSLCGSTNSLAIKNTTDVFAEAMHNLELSTLSSSANA